MENYETVLNFFKAASEPANAGAVAEATGIDKKEINKVMTKLKKEEKIVSPKRCYWELKR
ncbi:MarR family transcriptional regulator [Sporolactobacillus spathodeae]|uniref:DNA-binding IscR family transcriptional regulator n=1 Tax=Sporolactobacillus spathodeae TaxID=1465502 RepID=A0ABS2Q7E3_9BACL|nr:MarR family transcriptional regulator [Sporolactobacillus spathodeae]MBM7657521.1 DNA-binding IscR family transcriptional regulator [Sporolactobacillus spathodeae]